MGRGTHPQFSQKTEQCLPGETQESHPHSGLQQKPPLEAGEGDAGDAARRITHPGP